MRTGITITALVLLGAGRMVGEAQQASTNHVTTVSSSVMLNRSSTAKNVESTPMTLRLREPPDTNSMSLQVSKETRLRFSGPLVRPMKAKSPSGFLGRVAQWFNPFSKGEPNVAPAASGPMKSRAWTTVAGWSPGHSAFPSGGAWDEPIHLDLISVSTEKQPSR